MKYRGYLIKRMEVRAAILKFLALTLNITRVRTYLSWYL